MWWEGNPCNMHLNDLAAEVKAGVADAGMVGLRFNTIGVSDGISMGTDGMSYSLQSRDIIAGAPASQAARQPPGCGSSSIGVIGCCGGIARTEATVQMHMLHLLSGRDRNSGSFWQQSVCGSLAALQYSTAGCRLASLNCSPTLDTEASTSFFFSHLTTPHAFTSFSKGGTLVTSSLTSLHASYQPTDTVHRIPLPTPTFTTTQIQSRP